MAISFIVRYPVTEFPDTRLSSVSFCSPAQSVAQRRCYIVVRRKEKKEEGEGDLCGQTHRHTDRSSCGPGYAQTRWPWQVARCLSSHPQALAVGRGSSHTPLLPDTRMLSAPDTWWCLRHGSTPPTTLHHPQWEGRMARGRLRGPQDPLTLPRVTVLQLRILGGPRQAHGRTHTRCSPPPGRPTTGHLLHVLCAGLHHRLSVASCHRLGPR